MRDVTGRVIYVVVSTTVAPPVGCSLKRERKRLTFTDETGNLCESTRPVTISSCHGSCQSYDTSQIRLASGSAAKKQASVVLSALHIHTCYCYYGCSALSFFFVFFLFF